MPYDFRPNINIPTDAFKRSEDPYGSILPHFLQGQQAADLLRKKRSMQAALGQLGQQQMFQEDPIAKAFMPLMQSDPDVGMQLAPTMIANAYRLQAAKNKPGAATRTIYQDPNTGDVSGIAKKGWTAVTLPESQATIRLQTQGESNRRAGRFGQIFDLNMGKAENKITLDQESLIDHTNELATNLRNLQSTHAKLYPKYGGAIVGPTSSWVSKATGGTKNFELPMGLGSLGLTKDGKVPIPFSNPDVEAFNNLVDGTVGELKVFLHDNGRMSDKDIEEVLGKLKVNLRKSPEAAGTLFNNLYGILGAIQTNDINRVNKQFARLGISTRMKPNKELQQQAMQRQMMAAMMASGGNGGMDMNAMSPQDLSGMSTEQLQQLYSQPDGEE